MRVLETAVYRGPHLYSATPMVRIQLDLGRFEELPTDRLPGFADRLLELLPGLARHGCSRGRPGGFVERLQEGTWLGHVIEHVALELQDLAGASVSRGKTRSVRGRPGVYNIMFAYRLEHLARAAGRVAIELVHGLAGDDGDVVEGLDAVHPPLPGDERLKLAALNAIRRRDGLGPTTQSLVDEAERLGVPWARLDDQSLIRFGHGKRQRLMRASISGLTSHIAVQTAGDKALTKQLLAAGSVPVPHGGVVRKADEAVELAASIGGEVVIKPLDGNHGRGVSVGVSGERAVRAAFEQAAAVSRRVIVERRVTGADYRLLVIGGELAAVSERAPAQVVGDGLSTVRRLVANLNEDPRRGDGHEKVLTKVVLDAELERVLAAAGLTLDDVPALGARVLLRETANLSRGGEAIDRTDVIHPENRWIAERTAALIGLDIAGLDIITPDITLPIASTGGAVVEVNAAPGFRMHLQPSAGTPRPVARKVLQHLFPAPADARVPITAVTGTNGKSTTVRMIAHILAKAGRSVGMTTTSGVYVGGRLLKAADASGPRSARQVLADPTIDAAVLETARGGILREGLGFALADVGVVLNVTEDHLGLKGVDSLADLAGVKSIVVEQVRRRGASVLNADDRHTLGMARHARGRVIYFTMRGGPDLPGLLQKHLAEGGCIAALEPSIRGGMMVLLDGARRLPLLEAHDLPATLGGAARFNIQNALAAAAAAYGQGVGPIEIGQALRSFESSFERNPGRLNLTRATGFTTLLDYAHNPAALRALGEVVGILAQDHDRTIGVVSTPGDRRDEDIREMGAIAARVFDQLIFRERPDGRGRPAGDVLRLLSEGAASTGRSGEDIVRTLDEIAAAQHALESAGPRDLVVLMPTKVDAVWAQVLEFARSHSAPAAQPSSQVEARPYA
ncbi:cyanophycin synthetase [Phenylobacterium sp. LjRoot164]|uniref:cyanophycin synthetase n=1 Tax=unclassified Phenylobacterium TaxID=2640670 RepID=UPI003ED080D1